MKKHLMISVAILAFIYTHAKAMDNAHDETQSAEQLRKTYFDTVQPLASQKLDQRDPNTLQRAQSIYEEISQHYQSPTTRDNQFLYGLPLVLQPIPEKDKQPYRQWYSPIDEARKVQKHNKNEIASYKKTLAHLQTREQELEEELEKVRKDQAAQEGELTYLLRANKALMGRIAVLASALMAERDALRTLLQEDIDTFVTLKRQYNESAVGHAQTNISEQLAPIQPRIRENIEKLWYCHHYLERFKKPDGKLDWEQTIEWKFNWVDGKKLGILGYQDYLKYK